MPREVHSSVFPIGQLLSQFSSEWFKGWIHAYNFYVFPSIQHSPPGMFRKKIILRLRWLASVSKGSHLVSQQRNPDITISCTWVSITHTSAPTYSGQVWHVYDKWPERETQEPKGWTVLGRCHICNKRQQQRSESLVITINMHAIKYKVDKCH